jgi:citrate lyase subunit beta/citryl-CoA lyase
MQKAAGSDADELVLDLEDGCPVSKKAAARATLVLALNTIDFRGKVRAFRPNNARSRFFLDDLLQVVGEAGAAVDTIVLPKVEGPDEVVFVDRLLGHLELKHRLPLGRIRIEALIESAQALLRAEAIAKASRRLASLIFGVADYAGDVGAREIGKDEFSVFHYPKSHIVAAARAAGIDAIDSGTIRFRDLDQCRADAAMAAALGFDGKWAIHPGQVDVINKVFTPTPEEVERARQIFAEYDKADSSTVEGDIVVGDEMVDAATLRIEWKKLVVARKAGLFQRPLADLLEETRRIQISGEIVNSK